MFNRSKVMLHTVRADYGAIHNRGFICPHMSPEIGDYNQYRLLAKLCRGECQYILVRLGFTQSSKLMSELKSVPNFHSSRDS